MNEKIPSQDTLKAFGIVGEPALLQGGQGTCYRVEDVVLKPTNNDLETSWIASINNNLISDKFRVAKPLRAKDGLWVYNGWSASEFLDGKNKPSHYDESIEVSRNFHATLEGIQKPGWFDKKTDVFALSDRMAWGEIPLPDFQPASEVFKKIFRLLKDNRLPNQLIPGDWGPEQILFHDTLPPAVIDMTPYFRPADYPIADMMISAINHEGADISIIDLGKDIKDLDQLLLRALVMRTCTYIGFQIHPENSRDWISEIDSHLNMVDDVINTIMKFKY